MAAPAALLPMWNAKAASMQESRLGTQNSPEDMVDNDTNELSHLLELKSSLILFSVCVSITKALSFILYLSCLPSS